MARYMFSKLGMTVDQFYSQDLELYMNMQNAEEAEKIKFIDEI